MGEGKRGQVCEYQPADCRFDARQGSAGRRAPAAALFAGDAQRREGDRHAGGAAGLGSRAPSTTPTHQDRRGRSVRQRLRRGESQLEDPGPGGSQHRRRRRASSSPARSCFIWPRSSARSCRRAIARAECLSGCSGRWAARRTSVAASVISTPTRPRRSSTRSTALRWR